eukprot:Hpha_TRINITY_DN16596_c4_g2::TRINITY_DN16596_c4_g2_i1::g.136139::m.136139
MPNRREGGRGKGSTPVSVGVHGDESRGGRGRGLGKGAEGGGEAFAGTVWKQGPRLGSTPSPPPPEEDADYPPLGQVAQRSAAKQTSAPVPPPPAAGAGSNSPAQPPPPEPHSLFPPEPSQSPPPSSVYVEAKDPDDAQQLVMLLRQLGLVFMRPCKESGSGRPLNHFYAGFQQSEAVDVAVRALRGKGFVAAPSSIGADCWLDPRQKAFSPCVLLSNLPGSLSITDLDDMVQRHASVFLEVGSLGPYARPGETDTRYHVYVHFQNMRESETFLGDFHQFGFPRPVSATRSERTQRCFDGGFAYPLICTSFGGSYLDNRDSRFPTERLFKRHRGHVVYVITPPCATRVKHTGVYSPGGIARSLPVFRAGAG